MAETLCSRAGRKLAYEKTEGKGPGIVFLAGLKSDMDGTKAVHLEAWARDSGRAFLRFDYSGHGKSSGAFTDGCIGDWVEDARDVIATLTEGPQILVGSSMGGWISLILASEPGLNIAGIVGIAAAPDFTEDGFWKNFTDEQRAELAARGQVSLPSDYDEPYIITRRLIEDGRNHLVLRRPLALPFPARFLQGSADTSVDTSVALRLFGAAQGPDIRLVLVKGADHRFSTPDCLSLIERSIEEIFSVR